MRIGICDDDKFIFPILEREIRYCAKEIGMDVQIFSFQTESKLLLFLKEEKLELLFLDIVMPGDGGIGLAQAVLACCPDCQIAFCTNYLEYATEVYGVNHCYYVLKKEFSRRLPDVLRKVRQAQNANGRKFQIRRQGEIVQIDEKEICYIERRGKRSYVHTADGGCMDTADKLDVLLEDLSSGFIRCHNSYIVSLEKVKKYTRHNFFLDDGTEIPISRPYVENVRKAFVQWNWMNL